MWLNFFSCLNSILAVSYLPRRCLCLICLNWAKMGPDKTGLSGVGQLGTEIFNIMMAPIFMNILSAWFTLPASININVFTGNINQFITTTFISNILLRLLLLLSISDNIHLINSCLSFSLPHLSATFSSFTWKYLVPYTLPLAQVLTLMFYIFAQFQTLAFGREWSTVSKKII